MLTKYDWFTHIVGSVKGVDGCRGMTEKWLKTALNSNQTIDQFVIDKFFGIRNHHMETLICFGELNTLLKKNLLMYLHYIICI